jgi:hypothetical protein
MISYAPTLAIFYAPKTCPGTIDQITARLARLTQHDGVLDS